MRAWGSSVVDLQVKPDTEYSLDGSLLPCAFSPGCNSNSCCHVGKS